MKPARSLMVSGHYFPPQVGGISHMMWEICSALGPGRIAALTAIAGTASLASKDGAIRVYRDARLFEGTSRSCAWHLARLWPRIWMESRPDLLQFATCGDAMFLGYWLNRVLRLPFVIYAHGNELLEAERASWDRSRVVLRTADRVLANSRFTAQLLERLGVAPDRIAVVNPGCDIERFTPGDPSPALAAAYPQLRGSSPVLLTIGNLVLRKGQDVTLRALPTLIARWPDIRYVIAGDGRDRRELEALASSLGVQSNVLFLGRVPDALLPDLLRRCDLFVMPSRMRADHCDVEGFGIVFIEANACAKPVIGGRSGGIEDAIIDGQTGFLVDAESPDAVGASIAKLLEQPELARRMGEAGRERAVRNFSWRTIAVRIDEIASQVVANTGSLTRSGSPTRGLS
jgi:phosphatidylinositol alpha-1,6-mannosyltransferase